MNVDTFEIFSWNFLTLTIFSNWFSYYFFYFCITEANVKKSTAITTTAASAKMTNSSIKGEFFKTIISNWMNSLSGKYSVGLNCH